MSSLLGVCVCVEPVPAAATKIWKSFIFKFLVLLGWSVESDDFLDAEASVIWRRLWCPGRFVTAHLGWEQKSSILMKQIKCSKLCNWRRLYRCLSWVLLDRSPLVEPLFYTLQVALSGNYLQKSFAESLSLLIWCFWFYLYKGLVLLPRTISKKSH